MIDDTDPRRAPARLIAAVEHIVAPAADQPGMAAALQRLRTLVLSMYEDGARRDDPMREVPARLGDKWSSLLLLVLQAGSFRHSMLQRLVSAVGTEGSISQRMLTLRLRALERDGMILRRMLDSHPPGVEYALTPLGASLVGELARLQEWIRVHQGEIAAARAAFEAG